MNSTICLVLIKRCALDDCCVYGKVRFPNDIMKTVHHLPDSIPSLFDSDKFKRFDDAYGNIEKGNLINICHQKYNATKTMVCHLLHQHKLQIVPN